VAQKIRGLSQAELEAETRKLAADLAFCARAPVNIQLVGGAHIAYTYNCDDDKKQHQIPIVMNPETLKKVRNKEQAIRIWRGIGIHELAHHLFPASKQYRAADKEGFRHLFNLVDDEQNERRARAMDPEWGSCLQSVCAHVFADKRRNKDTINPGIIDGGKQGKKPRGIAATKVYTQRWNQFAFHFRLHVPDAPDPIVQEALDLIPKGFKELDKPALLDLTRQIHEVLSRGVEMPKEDPEKKPEEKKEEEKKEGEEKEGEEDKDKEKADDKDADEDEESEDEDEDEEEKKEDEDEDKDAGKDEDKSNDNEEEEESEDKGWSLKAILTSKWMLVPFALFVLIWTGIFLQGGIGFWLQLAIIGSIALVALVVFLFMRRAMIKTMLAAAKARIAAARAGPASPGATPKVAGIERFAEAVKKLRWILVAAIVVAGAGWLLHSLYVVESIFFALAAEILLLALVVMAANFLQNRAESSNSHLGRWVLIALLGSFAGMALLVGTTMIALGWLPTLVGAAAILGLGIWFLSIKFTHKQAGASGGASGSLGGSGTAGYYRESLWHRFWRIMREKWDDFWEAVGRLMGRFGRLLGRFFSWLGGHLGTFFCWVGRHLARFFVWLWGKIVIPFILTWRGMKWTWTRVIVPSWFFLVKWTVRGYWAAEPVFRKLWRHGLFRLAVIAVPVAVLLAMLYAVAVTAGQTSPWLLIGLILLLLLLLLLGFLFRKKLRQFVMQELLMPMPMLMDVSMQVPLDMTTDWFVQVDNIVPVQPDQALLDEMLPLVYPLAQQLRPYLKNCGRVVIDREDQPDGYDLTEDAELALVGETSIFVNDDTEPKPSVHLEVALDCSGSMSSPTVSLKPGEKFILGKFFALVLEQAVLNLPGVSAHFWGFTDNAIFDCGVPGEGRVSGLTIHGGNNDAAMLWHMGQSAAQSGKDVKILLMLSDGQPSECSWLALHNLVLQFEQEGMIPWNFALDVINVPAFERFFTDLVGQTKEEAIVTMGETLASIAQE
jgi:hypothetical protein